MGSTKETTWILKMREQVLGPLRRITELAGGAQRKIADLASTSSRFAREFTTSGKLAGQSLSQLTDKLHRLEDLQSRAWDPKHIQNYQRAINRVQEDIKAWNAKKILPENMPTSWFGKIKGQFAEAMSAMPGGSGLFNLLKSPALAYGTAALAVASFGKASVDASMQYQYGMAKVNATAQLPLATLDKLKQRLIDIGSNSGGNFARVPDAYEKILSVSGDVNKSIETLQVSIKGAKAGFTDLDVVGQALAQTMAAVGSQNTTAQEVMDTLLRAKAVGAGEFADFARFLPQLVATTRNIGIGMKDTAGLFAYMTYKGNDAAQSMMLLQNVATSLQKKDILVGLEKKGIKLFDVHGARRNITEILLDLSHKMDAFTDKQKTKFFLDIGLMDAQARTGWSVLLSDAQNLKRIMDEVNNSAGETDRQINATGNRVRDWGTIADQWKEVGVKLGDALMPVVDLLGVMLSGIVDTANMLVHLDLGPGKEANNRYRDQLINTHATNSAAEEYFAKTGFKPNDIRDRNFKPSEFNQLVEKYKGVYRGDPVLNPNHIVSDEQSKLKEAMKNLLDKNQKDNTNFDDGSSGTGGGNGGLKTLIMHVNVTNNFRKGDEKVKDKVTDDIVDAGRDALVTLGN